MSLLGKHHLSAQEIASLELDGLPTTKRGVQLLATRDGWAFETATGRGGTFRRYAVTALPTAARRDYADRWAAVAASQRPVGRPKGSDFFTQHPDVASAVEAVLAERPLAAARILELLATRFTDLPSRRTLARFMAQIERTKPALLAATRDPDLFKSKYRLALGRADASVSHAHQVWEIDTTKADVMTKDGRRSILGIVDVWSRRVFYLVVPSESAQSVRRTLTACIAKWGVMPEVLRTDNGSGYINATIKTALPHLGIELQPCPPGSPEKKPFVERMFGTFTRERAELLAGYVGHNVAEASKLRARAKKVTGRAVIVPELTADQLQAVIDAWLDGVYHVRPHSSTGAAPIARWTGSPRPARGAPDEGALKLALSAFVGVATVGKRGVQWKRGRYWAAPLADWIGRQVQLRRDEEDLGELYVFDEDSRYIATAVNAERSGLSDEMFARAAKRDQAATVTRHKAELRAKQRDFSIEDAVQALLRADAEAAGKLTTLPVATAQHRTAMLDSTAEAPIALPSEAAIAAAEARAPRKPAKVTSSDERIAETDRILAEADAGRPVDPDALHRARVHASSSEYRADKIVRGQFPARTSRAGFTPQQPREASL